MSPAPDPAATSASRALWTSCAALAWPLVLSNHLLLFTEALLMFWMGRMLGDYGMAIVTVTMPAFFVAACLFQSFAVGGSTMVSWSVGAKDGRGLTITASTVALTVLVSLVTGTVAIFVCGPLARALSPDPAIVDGVYVTLRVMFVFMLPLVTVADILLETANAAGWTKAAVGRSFIDLACMAGLTPLLLGPLGVGVSGAPLAQGIAAGILSVMMWMILRGPRGAELGNRVNRREVLSVVTWRRIMDIGVPVQVVRIAFFTAQCLLINRVARSGTDALVGYGLAMIIVQLGFATTDAVGQAGAILAGQAIGARDAAQARAAVRTSTSVALIVAAVFFLLMSVIPGPLMRMFSAEPAAIDAGKNVAAILRWALLPTALYQALLSGFAAYGATKRAGLIGLATELVALAFAYLWRGSGSPAEIVAVAVCISFGLKALTFLTLSHYVFRRIPDADAAT